MKRIYQNYEIDEELLRRACWVGPLTLAEARRRGEVEANKAQERLRAKMREVLGEVATTQNLQPGDVVRVNGLPFVMQ